MKLLTFSQKYNLTIIIMRKELVLLIQTRKRHMKEKRKVVLVGTGFVGMSFAYSMLIAGDIDEFVLIDINKEKAIGEAMDLQHGMAYAKRKIKIKAGDYDECKDADIVVITAGATQKPDETRLDLTIIDTKIVKNVTEQIMASGFNGILVVACNPVDIMTYVAQKVSKLPTSRVIGTGTLLDTARLRFILSETLDISTSNIHAYIMGEHGDSSFVPWDHAYVGSKKLYAILEKKNLSRDILDKIYIDVQQAGYEIVNRKKSTYYGIGLTLNRLVHALLNDEQVILTVSAYQNGEYGYKGIYNGVPALIGKHGVEDLLELELNEEDFQKFNESCSTLHKIIVDIVDPLL